MDNLKIYSIFKNPLTFISLFLSTFIILLYAWDPLTYKPLFLQMNNHNFNYPNAPNKLPIVIVKDELQIALEKASMANKTLIIAIINEAYVAGKEYPTMFDLFLEGFWAGAGTRPLLRHLLVVSMDRAAHERCVFRRLNCYRLAVDGGGDFAGEKLFMTSDFVEMMWRRTLFLLDVLNRGFSFIFTDTDVLWLRNPFPILMNTNETLDFQISKDFFVDPNHPPSELKINTGFYFIRSNEHTIALFEKWYGTRINERGRNDQDVMRGLMRDGVLEELGARTRFLDTVYFGGFCEDSRDVELVVTVHANCCQSIRAKIADLKMVLWAWNKFKTNGPRDFQWPIHTFCRNSWGNGTN